MRRRKWGVAGGRKGHRTHYQKLFRHCKADGIIGICQAIISSFHRNRIIRRIISLLRCFYHKQSPTVCKRTNNGRFPSKACGARCQKDDQTKCANAIARVQGLWSSAWERMQMCVRAFECLCVCACLSAAIPAKFCLPNTFSTHHSLSSFIHFRRHITHTSGKPNIMK